MDDVVAYVALVVRLDEVPVDQDAVVVDPVAVDVVAAPDYRGCGVLAPDFVTVVVP